MAELAKKQQRTIDFALDRLFTLKSILVPKSIKDFSVSNVLTRELQLTGNAEIFGVVVGLFRNYRQRENSINPPDIPEAARPDTHIRQH